jgi:hypothetical protein
VDPFSLLLLAQSAVSAIKSGCDMLKDGQVAVDEFREQAESLVGQAKEIYGTLQSIAAWAKSLWATLCGGKQETTQAGPAIPSPVQAAKPKAKKRADDPDPETLQMQVVHAVSTKLGEFFDIQQQISSHYQDLEVASLSVYDPDQNKAKKAVERVEVELQMEYLSTQIRETMVYAPKELKNLYSRFLVMYGKIEEEQEFARQRQIAAAKYKRVREWQHRNLKIELGMWAVGMGIVWLVLVAMLMQLASLSGQSLEWFSLASFASFVSQLRR